MDFWSPKLDSSMHMPDTLPFLWPTYVITGMERETDLTQTQIRQTQFIEIANMSSVRGVFCANPGR